MAPYIGFAPLSTTRLLNGKRKLNRDFLIVVDGNRMLIPAGTETDFSSYPWFSRVLVRFDRVDIAGVVHDWLYQQGTVSRREADRIWRLVATMGKHSANPLQAWLSWAGLRVGGWIAWNEHRKNARNVY